MYYTLYAYLEAPYVITEPDVESLGNFESLDEIDEYLEENGVYPEFSIEYLPELGEEVPTMKYNGVCFFIAEAEESW